MVVTILLGFLLFNADGPQTWLGLVSVLVVGVAAFAGMGFGVASLIRSDEGASAVVNLIVLPMAFLSGSFGSTNDYPEILQKIADVLPLTYLLRLTKGAYLHGDQLTSDLGAVAVLVAWGVGGYLVAARRFGWQPREK
jgi:ABC-2 type transport system permease protein